MPRAEKAAKEAESAKKESNYHDNKMAITGASSVAQQAETLLKQIKGHYDTKVYGNKTWERYREDYPDMKKLPEWYRKPYAKRHNDAFGQWDAVTKNINSVYSEIRSQVGAIEEHLDTAQGFSLEALDPSDVLAKVDKAKDEANKARGNIKAIAAFMAKAPDTLADIPKRDQPPARLQEFYKAYSGQVTTRMKQTEDEIKVIARAKKRIESLTKRMDDASVDKAKSEAMDYITEAAKWIKAYRNGAQKTKSAMVDAEKALSDLAPV